MADENIFQPTKVELDGVTFHIYPFSAIEAIKLKASFIQKIAPAFGQLVGSAEIKEGVKIEDMKLDGNALSKALEALCEKLTEAEFENLIRRFVKKVSCTFKDFDGKEKTGELQNDAVFNAVFTKRLMLVYKLIVEVIKVNYPDFFGLIGNIGSRLKTAIGN